MSRNHVRIGDYWYNLAEDAEGNHYQLSYPPQRSPNAVVVKGEQPGAQRFQTRPDIELWSITDWSGGEGKYKYDSQNPNQHALMYNVDGVSFPGTLRPGPSVEVTVDYLDAAITDGPYILVTHLGTLYALTRSLTSHSGLRYRTWDKSTGKWSSLNNVTGLPSTGTLNLAVDSDNEYIYVSVTGGELYRFSPGGGAATTLTSGLAASVDSDMATIGDYVYLLDTTQIKEVAKTASGATPTSLETFPYSGSLSKAGRLAKGGNRLYALLGYTSETVIREITPSTAAGSGFSSEVLRLPGFSGVAVGFQNGLLYIYGYEGGASLTDVDSRMIMYWAPGQELGTVGRLRGETFLSTSGELMHNGKQNQSLLSSLFFLHTNGDSKLFELDTLGGSIQQIAITSDLLDYPGSMVRYGGDWFFAASGGNPIFRVNSSASAAHSTGTSYFVSPFYDFGLADDKVLSSIKMLTDPLPADWNLEVWIDLGDNSWVQLTDQTTDNATSHTLLPSTATTTRSFGQMRVKVGFEYTGAGIPSTWPVLQAVEVRAQIAVHTRRWRLLVDLADELTSGDSGAKKIENLTTAAESEAVVRFDDKYIVRHGAGESAINVIIDALEVTVQRPGEGLAQIDLIEVA